MAASDEKLYNLREKHPNFIYKSFEYKKEDRDLVIEFCFKLDVDIEFKPKVRILNSPPLDEIDKQLLDNFIFHLGLAEIPSYWKAACSPKIIVEAGLLSENQINWWKKLYIQGLGELFFENKIDFTLPNFLTIQSTGRANFKMDNNNYDEKYQVLVGGGRDSALALELLKEQKKYIFALTLNPEQSSLKIIKAAKAAGTIVVKREIDPKLLELNKKGYWNGHTPFSSYLAFLSALTAIVFGLKYTVVANERSSDEENTLFKQKKINHQYSKTFEFENDFRHYSQQYLSNQLTYFSYLRPLYELQISKIFSKYPKYFADFRSCNRGQKNNVWCGECAKCLSIYISLDPFLEESLLLNVFGTNLLEKENLTDLLLHLIGKRSPKPFECVGTAFELQSALWLSIKKRSDRPLPFLLNFAKDKIVENKNILNEWGIDEFIPASLKNHLKVIND